MKSSSTDSPAWDGSNSSGFSALPAGNRYNSGPFANEGSRSHFWTTTVTGSSAYFHLIQSGSNTVTRSSFFQETGFPARCVQD